MKEVIIQIDVEFFDRDELRQVARDIALIVSDLNVQNYILQRTFFGSAIATDLSKVEQAMQTCGDWKITVDRN